VEQARRTILWGMPLQWTQWGLSLLLGLAVFLIGYAFFMRTKHAFADVM
jgi:lipopolysaccharide transport system permease protein